MLHYKKSLIPGIIFTSITLILMIVTIIASLSTFFFLIIFTGWIIILMISVSDLLQNLEMFWDEDMNKK